MKKQRIVAMIPARMGSTRLAMKNLAILNGKPLIYYSIEAAKKSGVFNSVIINSESDIFKAIAKRYGVDFYKRPVGLATSKAKSDSVVYDFIKNNSCDIMVWVNSIAPLQTAGEIEDVVKYFIKHKLDSLITVKDEQVHCLYKGKPVNYKTKGLFAKTQDLEPVKPFVYSVMMWRTDAFMKMFKKKHHAFFCGKFRTYPASKLASVIIKREEDLLLAEYILRTHKIKKKVRYDKIIKKCTAKL